MRRVIVDPENEYFSDGMTEEIINRLSRFDALQVLGRTSSFALKGFDGDPADIGARTGANYILEGSIRRTEQEVRISIQLARTADGVQVCAGAWDREMSDILGLQAEIASEIGRQLNVTIGPDASDDEFYGLPGTTDPDAYELYVRALGLDRAGGARNLRRAEALLREAIAIDPGFMAARGILARTLGSLRYWQPDQAEELLAEWNEITAFLEQALPENPIIRIAGALRLANSYAVHCRCGGTRGSRTRRGGRSADRHSASRWPVSRYATRGSGCIPPRSVVTVRFGLAAGGFVCAGLYRASRGGIPA